MLKGEHCGSPKKLPFGRPYIQGILKKSSSPVQTTERPLNFIYKRMYRLGLLVSPASNSTIDELSVIALTPLLKRRVKP